MFRWWNLISKLYNHAQWLSTTFYSFCLCVSKLGINEVGGESGATFCICQYIDKWTNTGAFELAFQLLPHQSEQPHWDILLNILGERSGWPPTYYSFSVFLMFNSPIFSRYPQISHDKEWTNLCHFLGEVRKPRMIATILVVSSTRWIVCQR